MKSTRKLPSSKFPRHEPEADLERAEQVLFEEMEHAAELLQSEEDFGRSGVRHALDACYSFLHVRGLSGQGLKPLIDLIAALESLECRQPARAFRSKAPARPDSGTTVVAISRFPRNKAPRSRLHGCVNEEWHLER